MPMAQALVMVRHKMDDTLEPMLSPMRAPLSPPPDASFITSTVRKRKPAEIGRDDSSDDGKKLRPEASERRASYGLGQTGLLLREATLQQAECDPCSTAHPDCPKHGAQHAQQEGACIAGLPGEGQHPHPGHQAHALQHAHPHQQHPHEQEGGTLFSPVFHLHHKEGEGTPPPASSAAAEAPALATPVPALCQAAPSRFPASEGSELRAAALEDAAAPRPHRPPPDTAALAYEPVSCCVAALSPLVSPSKPAKSHKSRCEERLEEDENVEDTGPACDAELACAMSAVTSVCDVPDGCDEEEYELEFDPLLFIKRLPPLEQCVPARRTSFLLPRQTRRSKCKTLVLDLDETLVHSTLDGLCRSLESACPPDFTFPVEVGNVKHMVSVRQRPHLRCFLERVARLFEVVVFTASQRVYAEQLLNVIDPRRSLIRYRVYRDSCLFWEGNYLKDLTVLGRDLCDTVIVDNSPQAFGFQLDNGIPIESWFDDESDEELLRLLPFLEQLALAEDVRPHIMHKFKLKQLVDDTPDPPRRLGTLFG